MKDSEECAMECYEIYEELINDQTGKSDQIMMFANTHSQRNSSTSD